jgi:Holliday junction resolvase
MAHSLNKGRNAEREVVNLLQPILDHAWSIARLEAPKLQRRGLGFSGQDIIGLDWLALEIKFHAKPHVDMWWKQCVEQAGRINGGMAEPVLCYKTNHKPWRVRMYGCAGQRVMRPCIVDISWEDFEWWFFQRCQKDVEKECDKRAN